MFFRFVKYGKTEYPDDIKAEIVEIAGHFDKETIDDSPDYSLHTEYSYGKRLFSSPLIQRFPALCAGNKDGVPQLWKSVEWANQFAQFVLCLTETHSAPKVIEIHPPFNDYCDMDLFLERYSVFEKEIHKTYPDVMIVIENRAGSIYRGGRFVISKAEEIALLCSMIRKDDVQLGVALDFPQLLTAEHIKANCFEEEKYYSAIEKLCPHQDLIRGIHIWGKKKSKSGRWVAHSGTLDTFFDDPINKACFIKGIKKICSDGRIRFLVPEVNSGAEDLQKVIRDIIEG